MFRVEGRSKERDACQADSFSQACSFFVFVVLTSSF